MIRRVLLPLQLIALIVLASLTPAIGQETSPEITGSLSDQLIVDIDGDNQIDPGDTVRYTLDVTNCGPGSANDVTFDGTLDPNTALVPGSAQVGAPSPANCPPTDGGTGGGQQPQIPSVVSTNPADGAATVTYGANIEITFSEAVSVTGDWFQMVCATSGTFTPSAANITVTGGTTTYTLDPNVDLQPSETCTITIFAAQVSDSDGSTLAADYVFAFTTEALETPPTVMTTSPLNGAVNASTTGNIVITFDEPVNATDASFALACPAGTPRTFTTSGSGTSTITLDPVDSLPAGTSCDVTAIATLISDTDSNDPPDLLDGNADMTEGDDYNFTFVTETDAAPSVLTIDPAAGAVNVATSTDIDISFSEPVNVSSGAFTLECPASNPIAFSVTPPLGASNVTNFTLTPSAPLPEGETCVVTVFAANVTDTDTVEPPDNMAADFSATFTTEAPPSVSSTTPTNGATGISTGANIVITFSEAVDVTTSNFTLDCPAATAFTVNGSGTNTITLDPTPILPAGTLCNVTVLSSVADSDTNDPPDTMTANYPFSFTTGSDDAPTVSAITPTNGATNVATNTTVEITFSESVDVSSAAAFSLACPTGNPYGFTVTTPAVLPASATSFIITPAGLLPDNTTCTVTVFASEVTDTDPNEPPDNMAADFSATFTTDAPPSVSSTTPTNGATSVATGANIVITFSEAVNASSSDFTLDCPAATAFTVSGSGTNTITLDPTPILPAGTLCNVTVLSSVADSDANDPPDTMTANYIFTFSTVVDIAPTVDQANIVPASTSAGANTATLDNPVSTTPTITLPFSEAINAATGAITLGCPGAVGVTVTPGLPTTNQTSLDVSPSVALPPGANCTLTVVAANISDTDTDDPPNLMLTDYTVTFTVDTAPIEILTETEVGNVFQDVTGAGAANVDVDGDIRITFSEAVNVTLPADGLQCPSGTNIPVTVTGNGTNTITLNPNSSLLNSVTCVLNIPAANISDVDTADAPDNSAAVNHTFTTAAPPDTAPTVSSTTPTNGATGISTGTSIVITFSEAVNVSGTSFTMFCGATPIAAAVVGTGTNTITLDPLSNLPANSTCTVTVVAAQVTDSDTNDPPDTMAANYVFSFSTVPDDAPFVSSIIPANGATSVATNSTIQITFSEPVDIASAAAFSIECPTGSPQGFTITTPAVLPASATDFIVTPAGLLPDNTTCTVTVVASQVTDTDTDDPPDTMTADFVSSFTMALPPDDAPTVTTNPANGGANVALNTNITVTFNEPVTLTGAWFDLDCSVSGVRTSTGELTGTGITVIENTPDLVYTIDPTVDFAAGDICTITIDSANVVDNDAIDPPNELDGDASFDIVDGDADDYTASFSTTDMAPRVSSTTPTESATSANNQVVTINFTEVVDIAAGAISWQCGATPITFTPVLPQNNVTSIMLTPSITLPNGSCTVTLESTLITDDDAVDPPNQLDGDGSLDVVDGDADDFVLTFTTDIAPSVSSTTPADGATNVGLGTNIIITFSEPVDVTGTSFVMFCGVTPIGAAVSGTGTNTITLDPLDPLPTNSSCEVTVVAIEVADSDANDPPDTMTANYVFDFTTVNDNAPSVTSAEAEVSNVFTALPLGGGVYADTDTNLRLTFSEAVTIAGNWAALSCTTSGIQDVSGGLTVTDADPVFTLNPGTELTPGENCTLTIFAAQVSDDDALDPPDVMAANAVYTFTMADTPPQVNTGMSSPANGATVPNNQTATINFTEIVDIAAGAISWQCGVTSVSFTPALPQNNVTSITLTPNSALPAGSCTVTLESTLITDDDAVDPPNQLDGDLSNDFTEGDADDYSVTFTVDAPPQLFSISVDVGGSSQFLPLVSGQVVDLESDIRIIFTEPIDATATGITLECPAGSPVAFPGLPLTNTTNFTVNPSANLPSDTPCILTFVYTDITDTDTFDPPNQLDGNFDFIEGPGAVFLFTTEVVADATDDAYTVTPHLTYTSPTGVRGNDNPVSVTVTGFGNTLGSANGTTPNGTNSITAGGAGGRVVMNADGTFVFYPDASDDNTDGTVTFFYTIAGGDTAQVTLTFEAEEFVWFADQSPPGSAVCTGTNNGTQACPEDTLADVAAADTANDVIFIDDGNYTCGITLLNDEIVIGDGSSSTLAALVASRVTPVAGSDFAPYNTFGGIDPVLTSPAGDCFTLGQNNTIRGLTVDNTPSGHAFQDNGGTIGTATLAEVSFSGSGGIFNLANGGTLNATLDAMTSTSSPSAPILLTNMGGTITQTGGGTITHTGNFDLFDVNGGTVSASISANLNATGGNGSVLDVTNGHAGTLNFTGIVSSVAPYTGDNLQFDNADGVYNFNGETDLLAGSAGVNIQSGSGGTFTTTNTNSSIANIAGISFRVNASTMTINTALDITHTSQSNRGVEMITGTGTTNFTGTLQLGTVGSRMLSAEGVFLDDTGAANAITFSDLNIITGVGGGAGSQAFVSQTSGRIAVTTGSIDCNGNIGADNHCFDVSNTTSSGVTFASFLSDHDDAGENGGAIYLNNAPGTFTFTNVPRLTGNNAAIIQALNFGTLNVGTGSTGNMETSNRPVWNLENGAVNLNATVLRSTNSTTEGIRLVNLNGTGVTTTGTIDIDLSPASPYGILLQNITAGAYNFSAANTISITDRPNEGIYLNNVDGGSVSFGNTTISNPGGTTEAAVRGENGASSVTFAQLNINQGNSGAGETFAASLPNGTSGAGDAVYFNAMTGGITINGGTIQNAADDAIDVRSSSNVSVTGVTLVGRGTANCDGCFGVQIFNGSGIYQLDNLTISDFQGNSGGSPTAPAAIWQGMSTNNILTLDIDGGTWTGNSAAGNNSTYGFGYYGYNQVGTITLDIGNTNLNDFWNRGVQVTGGGSANLITNIRNANFNGTGAGGYSGIELFTSGAHTGMLQFVIDNNTFIDTMDFAGFVIRLNLNDNTNAAFTNSISGNTITETAAAATSGTGISILLEENVDLDVNINNNTITSIGGNAVAITANAVWTVSGLLEFNMLNNTFGTAANPVGQAGGALSKQAVLIRIEGSGTVNGRLDGGPSIYNTVAGVGATDGTVVLRNGGGSPTTNFTVNNLTVSSSGGNTSTVHAYAGSGTMCVNITNSTANGGFGEFKIQEIAGATQTYTFAGNNPAAPTLVGAPTVGGGCTLPVVMAAPQIVDAAQNVAFTVSGADEQPESISFVDALLRLGASPVSAQSPATVSLNLGSIPAGTHVTATFDVVVGEVPPNVNSIALQGVVSGSNFPAVLTNDPATAAALDPTISLLDPLRSVTQLPATGESPDWRNWAIAGALASAVVIGAAFKKYLRRSA